MITAIQYHYESIFVLEFCFYRSCWETEYIVKEFETIGTMDECLDFLMLDVAAVVAPVIAPLETLTRDFLFTALASRVGDINEVIDKLIEDIQQ